MRADALIHGPYIGTDWECVRIGSSSEGTSMTAISVGDQSNQQARARIGYQLAAPTSKYRPYAQLSYDYQYLKNERTYLAGMGSTGTMMPVTLQNNTGGYGRLAVGGSTNANGKSEVSVGLSSTFGHNAGRDTAINLVWSAPL